MQPHQIAHQGQADARSFDRSAVLNLGAVEAIEDQRQLGRTDSHAGIRNFKVDALRLLSQRHLNATFQGELERVGQQVDNDGLPHLSVNVYRLAQARAVHRQGQSGALACRSKVTGQVGGQGRQVGRHKIRVNAARIDARKIEQRVDQLQQAQGIAMGDLQTLCLRRGQAVGHQGVFEGPQYQGEWRAKFVADIREEDRLGPIDGRQQVHTLTLAFGHRGASQSGPKRRSQQRVEPPVRSGQRAA